MRTLSRFVALSEGRVMSFFPSVLVVLLEVNTLVLAAIMSVDLTIGQSHADGGSPNYSTSRYID